MSNPNPAKRMDADELWKFVSQYEINIIQKQQFIVNNPPPLIENGVSVVKTSMMRSKMK